MLAVRYEPCVHTENIRVAGLSTAELSASSVAIQQRCRPLYD